jgi:hypothetical protein
VKKRNDPEEQQLALPLGARFFGSLKASSLPEVREQADAIQAQHVFEAMEFVLQERSELSFLHSAMCAMSLPIKRPKDEMAPIIRRDGNYSLIIQPLERVEPVGPNGAFVPVKRGVPFGKHARLILLYIMTEAVTRRSREIYLGNSFSAFLRRMGITSANSGGTRGTRGLVQEQIDRLMNSEWTMRWDERAPGKSRQTQPEISAFAVNDMRLANGYVGMRTKDGDFVSHFVLSETFYENLVRHSVPFNDRAIAALKDSATQLDLYTWLAYRLPRIPAGQEIHLSWKDLADHLGNETSTLTKFRQTIRDAWSIVSGVYQQAGEAADFSGMTIILRHASPPTDGHMIMVPGSDRKLMRQDHRRDLEAARRQGSLLELSADKARTLENENVGLTFPKSDSLRYVSPELYEIGRRYGSGNDVTILASHFRKLVGDGLGTLKDDALRRRWQAYCEKWPKPAGL